MTFGEYSFGDCHKVGFESIFLFDRFDLDLPKLHTILFNGQQALEGNEGDDNVIIIDGEECYNNILYMRSKMYWRVN